MSDKRLSTALLIAGVFLLLLLPAGSAMGTGSFLFGAVFIVHLLALFAAAILGLISTVSLFRQSPWIGRLSLMAGAITLCLSLLESTLPVTFRDSLIHHLAVPQWWIEAGHIFSPAWHEWSFYPMLVNLGFAGLIGSGFEALAGSYSWMLTVLFCMVIASGSAKISGSRSTGALAFMISATLPIVHRLAPLPTADMGLALFSAVAFFSLLERITASGESTHDRDRKLLLTGIAFGLALGCKYNALPFTLFSLLLLLKFLAQKSGLQALRSTLIVAFAALIIYSPWLLRNYALTSNPIYPLYSNIFKPSVERPSGIPDLKPIEQRILIYQENPLEIALLPIRIFLQGDDNHPAHFDGALSPLLLLGFIGCLMLKKDKAMNYSAALALLVIIASIFLNPLRVRYLATIFAPLCFMTACTLSQLLTRGTLLRSATLAAIAAHLFLFGSYAVNKARTEELAGFLSGSISREQYLTDRIAEYPMIQYINQEVSPDKTIYLLFTGNRFALYTPETFSGGHYSASVLVDWIRKSEKSGKPLRQFFREHPIDYILADSERSQSFALEQLNESERQIWTSFIKEHLIFVHEQRGFSLWKVGE